MEMIFIVVGIFAFVVYLTQTIGAVFYLAVGAIDTKTEFWEHFNPVYPYKKAVKHLIKRYKDLK